MNLKERVRQRVEELGESPITLAKAVGLERGYINDILIGRKVSIRGDKINLVAKALQCDPAFLTQEKPTPQMMFYPPGIPVLGACQSGVWRDADAKPDYPATLPIAPDARFPLIQQGAFLIRGHAISEGSRLGAAALGIELDVFERSVRPIENGMAVAVRRERGGLVETSLRAVETGRDRQLVSMPCDRQPSDPIPFPAKHQTKGLTVLAVVTCCVKLML